MASLIKKNKRDSDFQKAENMCILQVESFENIFTSKSFYT